MPNIPRNSYFPPVTSGGGRKGYLALLKQDKWKRDQTTQVKPYKHRVDISKGTWTWAIYAIYNQVRRGVRFKHDAVPEDHMGGGLPDQGHYGAPCSDKVTIDDNDLYPLTFPNVIFFPMTGSLVTSAQGRRFGSGTNIYIFILDYKQPLFNITKRTRLLVSNTWWTIKHLLTWRTERGVFKIYIWGHPKYINRRACHYCGVDC